MVVVGYVLILLILRFDSVFGLSDVLMRVLVSVEVMGWVWVNSVVLVGVGLVIVR